MAPGDVITNISGNVSESSLDSALTALRSAVGASGTYGVFGFDGKVGIYSIEEA